MACGMKHPKAKKTTKKKTSKKKYSWERLQNQGVIFFLTTRGIFVIGFL